MSTTDRTTATDAEFDALLERIEPAPAVDADEDEDATVERVARERELIARVVEALGRTDLAHDYRLGRLSLPLIEEPVAALREARATGGEENWPPPVEIANEVEALVAATTARMDACARRGAVVSGDCSCGAVERIGIMHTDTCRSKIPSPVQGSDELRGELAETIWRGLPGETAVREDAYRIADAVLALLERRGLLVAEAAVQRVRELADWFDGGGAGVPRLRNRGATSNTYAAICIRRALDGGGQS